MYMTIRGARKIKSMFEAKNIYTYIFLASHIFLIIK